MNAQIKELWVAALTGGQYKRGTMRLRTGENTFCCLGVLCDIYIKETGKAKWEGAYSNWQIMQDDGKCEGGGLTMEILNWAGLPTGNALVKTERGLLSTLNDSGTHEFPEIAEVIKQQL